MSVPFDPKIIVRRTDANLTSKEWLAVKPNGDNDTDVAGAGENVIGVLTDDVADFSTTAGYVPVQVGGFVKVKFGGAVTAGVSVKSDASGKAVAASTGDRAFGVAWETGADGDLGVVQFSIHSAA